jgi:hypothetical protein
MESVNKEEKVKMETEVVDVLKQEAIKEFNRVFK